jgi:FAD/FMN-containing dehydrogenase
MSDVEVDTASGTAWVEAGVTAGAFTAAVHAAGYAVPFGDAGSVGVAGITLGGGRGWLVRRYGLTIDSLLAAEVITAAGDHVVASSTQHPDLFWALRGGGGNFGVVARFRFELRPVDTVLAGDVIVPATPEVLGRLVDVLASAPDGLPVMPSSCRRHRCPAPQSVARPAQDLDRRLRVGARGRRLRFRRLRELPWE